MANYTEEFFWLCVVACTGLWGVVNNAGVCYLADLEMTSEKLFRKILDVNLLGVVNVTKAFLPLIRQAKGRIVNVSSIAGLLHITVFVYILWGLLIALWMLF